LLKGYSLRVKTISWGDRSDLLTKSNIFQNLLIDYLDNKFLSTRDRFQLQECQNFLQAIENIRNTSTYLLIENSHLGDGIQGSSQLFQRLLDPVTQNDLQSAKEIFAALQTNSEFEIGKLYQTLTFLQIISFDLAHEIEEDI